MSDIQLAGLVVSVLAAVGGLVVTLLRLQAGIAEQFTRSRTEDEGRTKQDAEVIIIGGGNGAR